MIGAKVARSLFGRKLRTFSYTIGILVSTASTYLLFLAFSLRSAPEHLGAFALISGVAAIFIQFIDGVSSQRMTQAHPRLSGLCSTRQGSVNYLNPGRLGIVLFVGLIVSVVMAFFDLSLAVGVGVLVVGQGAYSFCASSRVFGSSPKSLLLLQFLNCFTFCVAATFVFFEFEEMTPASLLLVSGLASFSASLPFLTLDIMDRCSMELSMKDEFRNLYSSGSLGHLGGLIAYQAVNACGSTVDTLLTAIGGLRTAAEYQVIRRPMLALSSLNVALGQSAINKYSRDSTADWRRSLIVLLPVLVAWPLLGFLGLIVVRSITPADYDVSISGGCLLAFSFALGAFLQITGTVVLVRMNTLALLLGAVVRIVALVLVAFLAVPTMGVAGLGLSLVVANAVLLGVHVSVLVRGDRLAEIAKFPVTV